MKKVLTFILLICPVLFIKAQDNDVFTKIDFHYSNETFTIEYDINQDYIFDSLNVEVEIYFAKTFKYKLTHVSGSIGKVSKGAGKKIFWIPSKEGFVIDEEVYVILIAKPIVTINKKNHLFKSIIFPGLGDNKARNGKANILSGVVAYGGIGSAIYLNRKAITSYDLYKKEYELERSKTLFKQAKNYKNLSLISAGVSTLVWTLDLALLNRKINKLKKNNASSNFYSALSNNTYSIKSNPKHINTKTPYDLAMESGNKYFDDKKYDLALEQYKKAKNLKATELADDKIKQCQEQINLIAVNNQKYNKHIKDADDLLTQKKYKEAKDEYNKALQVKNNETYPKRKIEEIENILKEEQKKIDFAFKVKEGDALLKSKDYQNAKSFYETANSIIAYDDYVLGKIKECNKLIAADDKKIKDNQFNALMTEAKNLISKKYYQDAVTVLSDALAIYPNSQKADEQLNFCYDKISAIEEVAINKDYKDYITEADKQWNNRSYDNAKTYYELALAIKPYESYPQSRIQKIKDMKNEEVVSNSPNNFSTIFESKKTAVFYINTPTGSGTGFFVSSEGIAVSCYHVFEDVSVKSCEVILMDGSSYSIEKILDQNEAKDYIIFKVKKKNISFNYLKISQSDPKPLEDIMALGYSDGYTTLFPEKGTVNIVKDGDIYNTTNITFGYSGGPLINSKGEVVGVNAGGFTPNKKEYKFAISIQTLKLSRFL